MSNLRAYGKRLASRCKPLFRMLYAVRVFQQRFLLWAACIRHPINPYLVMFDAFQSQHYCDSPKALYLELMQNDRYTDYSSVWVLRDLVHMQDKPDLPRTRIVRYDSPEYRRSLVCARYIVTNSMMPPFWKKRRGQTLIQTWHGTPLKRLGCDLTADCNKFDTVREMHQRYHRQAAQFSYLLSPSAFCSEKLTSAFDLKALNKEDILIEEGYPRNDRLYRWTEEDAQKIRRRLSIPEGKTVVLYAPTFRDNQQQEQEYVYIPALDFDALIDAFGDNVVWLFRTHYFISSRFDFDRFGGQVRDVSGVEDINDLYIISDLLMTDYSSVFFDYANLRRPILFYMYDREEYQYHLRNFYLDLSELPGPIVQTQDELIPEIRRLLAEFEPDAAYRAFCDRFTYRDDGEASRRVWEELFRREKQDKLPV